MADDADEVVVDDETVVEDNDEDDEFDVVVFCALPLMRLSEFKVK